MHIFLVTDELVSEGMEEDITSELPYTLAIENSTQDSPQPNNTDQVSFSCLLLSDMNWMVRDTCHKCGSILCSTENT